MTIREYLKAARSPPRGDRAKSHAFRLCRGLHKRKNYLFVGSEVGGKAAAIAYTMSETTKLNAVDPHAWLADTLDRLPDHKITRLDDLLPWRWSR